ncbi:MAG: InlB B-repeat-containing protein [Planctomycetota bacterium]|jgi:hypothetical protein
MMRKSKINLVVFCVVGITLAVLSSDAYCQSDGVALLVQVSPPGAGTVTPGPGVHRFTTDSQVDLSAVPNEGYQFVYWLGDVIEPTKGNTLAVIDSPKILIAVFERSNFEFAPFDQPNQVSFGTERTFVSLRSVVAGRGGGGGSRRSLRIRQAPGNGNGDNGEESDFPVPDEPDIPVAETPEPATGGLLLLGAFMALARRKRRCR